MQQRRAPNFGILVAITYGLVAFVTLLAVATYYYYRADIKQGDQADPNPMRRMMVGAVWVPIFTTATYVDPASVQEKDITTGSVKFTTKDPPGTVLAFYEESLKKEGYFTTTTGDAGGTIQAQRAGGKFTVGITVTSSSENTKGEIRTLHHADAKDRSRPQ
jgi:hypothetical protein